MSDVGLVLVTHGDIGYQMLTQARLILGEPLLEFHALAYSSYDSESSLGDAIRVADAGEGVLVLTDLGGASPANHAVRATAGDRCRSAIARSASR